MSRFSTNVILPKRTNSRPQIAESLFYLSAGAVLLAWAISIVIDLSPKILRALNLQSLILKNSGSSMLILALILLSAVAFFGCISALRSRPLPSPSASVLLITACALRSLEILTDGSVTVGDANLLGGLFLAASFLYFGPTRFWWFLLMPLAAFASFSPLVWFEFFKGAPTQVLIDALYIPSAGFIIGSFLLVLRELRARANANFRTVQTLRVRGESTRKSLLAMQSDLKRLNSILSGEHTSTAPLETTEFNLAPQRAEPSEACAFDEIDMAARRLLDEARNLVEGRPVKLSLTAPTGSGLPVAVRGSAPVITSWMKAAILNSIESLGGFPDGAVRLTIRPSLASLVISIEDNGRGFGESLLTKMGHAEGRLSVTEIRAGVERLGGRFDIQARLGVGSRLSIELPRIDAFANSPRVSAASAAARIATLQKSAQGVTDLH
jgi:signal transduction histidine kinase